LEDWYAAKEMEVNEARLRMARIPDDAVLIPNPVSGAPGFKLGNTFVMAGVPRVMRAMLHNIGDQLQGGQPVLSVSIKAVGLKEGDVAKDLTQLAEAMPDISIGSYPWYEDSGVGVALVARSVDSTRLDKAETALTELATRLGTEPVVSRN